CRLSSFENPAVQATSRQDLRVPTATSAAVEAVVDTEPTWPGSPRFYRNLSVRLALVSQASTGIRNSSQQCPVIETWSSRGVSCPCP
ncbi:hypothetical protein CCMA1212_008895, partial [Trichoderma ghanense]